MRRYLIRLAALPCCAILAATAAGCHPGSSALREGELIKLAALDERQFPGYIQDLDDEDSIGSFYRSPATKAATKAFFASLSGSAEVAEAILDNAERCSVSPSLAFALAFEESRFDAKAIHRNSDSVDRGLFQLNSKSFPKLSVEDFYDPAVNARNGVAHLQYCLSTAGNEVAALAMYNAGHGKVTRGATPRRTLDYVFRVLKYQENIASLFEAKVARARGGVLSRIGLGFIRPPRPAEPTR